jgi:hypothetical protein
MGTARLSRSVLSRTLTVPYSTTAQMSRTAMRQVKLFTARIELASDAQHKGASRLDTADPASPA